MLLFKAFELFVFLYVFLIVTSSLVYAFCGKKKYIILHKSNNLWKYAFTSFPRLFAYQFSRFMVKLISLIFLGYLPRKLQPPVSCCKKKHFFVIYKYKQTIKYYRFFKKSYLSVIVCVVAGWVTICHDLLVSLQERRQLLVQRWTVWQALGD